MGSTEASGAAARSRLARADGRRLPLRRACRPSGTQQWGPQRTGKTRVGARGETAAARIQPVGTPHLACVVWQGRDEPAAVVPGRASSQRSCPTAAGDDRSAHGGTGPVGGAARSSGSESASSSACSAAQAGSAARRPSAIRAARTARPPGAFGDDLLPQQAPPALALCPPLERAGLALPPWLAGT